MAFLPSEVNFIFYLKKEDFPQIENRFWSKAHHQIENPKEFLENKKTRHSSIFHNLQLRWACRCETAASKSRNSREWRWSSKWRVFEDRSVFELLLNARTKVLLNQNVSNSVKLSRIISKSPQNVSKIKNCPEMSQKS